MQPYRELLGLIHEYEGDSLFDEVLCPWKEEQSAEIKWLRRFAERRGNPIPPASQEDLWRLYALSRVNETLLLRFQAESARESWQGPNIALDEYVRFMEALGLAVSGCAAFTPFFHEIVTVQPAAVADHPITLLRELWPSLTLGSMMFSRAGVEVIAGSNFALKEVAEASTLYWAYWRKNRPTHDLGKEWGSNSQWRTALRRDYQIGTEAFYNVDGKYDISLETSSVIDHDELNRKERLELLLHRCLLSSTTPNGDLFPYDNRARFPTDHLP